MREAMLIAPVNDNNGASLRGELDQTVATLIDTFGGVTISDAFGSWSNGGKVVTEPVKQLVVAMDQTPENDSKFRFIAESFGRLARQLAVYVRYASGSVEIIATDARLDNVRPLDKAA